ncbi:ABC transporter ATP-binding protein [Leucobacter tenebrionis]|uniref:ABC transporter ATP-binding protein n=1 Tax=Leucobacter tenebrionis TaxID=2873270 RepID=UPI001CA674C0|nr:ABC transporter ATP-binding protein [Leucobacter tenebrionis]QZY51417.1 ABC transporter ATP-binding protein/permease [Leucobacter tenebrionis]
MRRAAPTQPGALRRTLSLARPHLRGNRLLLTGGVLALLGEVALRVLEPWPIKFVIDAVSVSLGATGGANAGTAGAGLQLLLSCGLLLLGIVGLRAVAQYCSTVAFALAGSRIATQLRSRVFQHLQSLGLRYHSRAPHGDNVQRLVGDVGRLQDATVTAGLPLIGNAITLVVLAVVMAFMDPLLAGVVAVAVLAYLLLSRRGAPRIAAAAKRTRRSEGDLANTAAETFGAIRVVQAYGLEPHRGRAFEQGNRRALGQGVASKRLAAALERGTDVIVGAGLALVLVIGGLRVIEGALTPGDLVIFTTYLKLALRPLKDLAKHTGRIARAVASGERVADLLDEPVDIADRPGARPLREVRGSISFTDVDVDDGRGRPLFRGLSLEIPAGSSVCLLGPSGAGKSTLVGLITRASDPLRGAVAIDGVDLREATLASIRGSASVVLQESVLFATTVRENIRLGRLEATDEEVVAAARRALADDFIRALPDGYDTELGDRGGTLSGGQRQRIAIARALLRDAPIVILDEATTGLDPASKEQVSASIAELTAGRTTISVTHDPAAIRGADRILWIEDGRIVEDGGPLSLLADRQSRLSRWMRATGSAAPSDRRPA